MGGVGECLVVRGVCDGRCSLFVWCSAHQIAYTAHVCLSVCLSVHTDGSDQGRPSDGSAGEEEEGEEPLPPPADMDPLDPSLMPRPLLCSTADSTSAFSGVGEMEAAAISTGLPIVGEGAESRQKRNSEEVGQSSLVAPSGSSLITSQSVTTTGSVSLYGDVGQLEAAESDSDKAQLEVVTKSLSSIHELLGVSEPDVSSVVSSSQGGGDVESFLSRIASGTPMQPAEEPVGSHTLEDTFVSEGLPTTTQEGAEKLPTLAKDDAARESGGQDQGVSPDNQVKGSPPHQWPDVGDMTPPSSFASIASSSLSSSTPPDSTAPHPDWDSGQAPEFFTSHQVGSERVPESPLLGISQLVQEAVGSTAQQTTGPEAVVESVLSELLPPLPPQTQEPTTSGSAHLVSQPVGASEAPTIAKPPPAKVLPVMKGVKLGVVTKRKEEEGPSGLRKDEEGPSGLRKEEEGPSGLRKEEEERPSGLRKEEEGPSGLRMEEEERPSGLRKEEEGPSGLRMEEEEGPSGLRMEEEGQGGLRMEEEGPSGLRKEEEGPSGLRMEEEGPSGSSVEEGPSGSSVEEGPGGSLSEDRKTEEAEEEETPHDSSHQEQLVISREQEGVVMWTQLTTDVRVPW